MRVFVPLLMTSVMLAACGSQQAGYEIEDRNHSLSVTRVQNYPGAQWETHLVVSRFPECQRRYLLKPTGDKFKMDIYQYQPGVFILNQGKRWYVAETKECRWDQYKEAPPEPGELVGAFVVRDEELSFRKADADGAKAKKKPDQG